MKLNIVLKTDQRTNKLTFGIVKDILTDSQKIMVLKGELQNGQVGRNPRNTIIISGFSLLLKTKIY